MTAEGQQISDPVVRWSSSNSSVADVDPESGFVRARTGGDATIRVANSTDTTSDQTLVRVLFPNPK